MILLAAFVISLTKNYLATREIWAISQRHVYAAAMLAGVNSAADFAITYLIVVDAARLQLLIPVVIGNVLSTAAALRFIGKNNP